jgi:hypothetical protein
MPAGEPRKGGPRRGKQTCSCGLLFLLQPQVQLHSYMKSHFRQLTGRHKIGVTA